MLSSYSTMYATSFSVSIWDSLMEPAISRSINNCCFKNSGSDKKSECDHGVRALAIWGLVIIYCYNSCRAVWSDTSAKSLFISVMS